MNQLTEAIIGDKPKRVRLTHKRCQELRRRIIRCSQSFSAFGDMMLDFDIAQADIESLTYIAQLLVMHENISAWQYYLKTTLQGQDQELVKETMRQHLTEVTQERSTSLALNDYKTALKTKGNKYLIQL